MSKKKQHATREAYATYKKSYKERLKKYGSMIGTMYTYEEYKDMYEAAYLDRIAEGKDTKNINRILVNRQTYEKSDKQAKALQTFYESVYGERYRLVDIKLGRVSTDIEEEAFEYYKQSYDALRRKYPGYSSSMILEMLGESLWGSQ